MPLAMENKDFEIYVNEKIVSILHIDSQLYLELTFEELLSLDSLINTFIQEEGIK